MIPEYKRSLNQSFLLLPGTDLEKRTDYQWEMVCANRFYELLSCNKQVRDGKLIYNYEISSKQNIKRFFENKELTYENIKNILVTIHTLLIKMREHLLDENCLLLYPEYIYFDMDLNEVQLVFYPESTQKIQLGLKELTEFFLSRTNHKDEKAVEVVYLMFKDIKDENFTLAGIINLFEKLEHKEEEAGSGRNEKVDENEYLSEFGRLKEDKKEIFYLNNEMEFDDKSKNDKEVNMNDTNTTKRKNHIFVSYLIAGILLSIFIGRSMKGDNFLILCYGSIIVLLTSVILFFMNKRETLKYEKLVSESIELAEYIQENACDSVEEMFTRYSEVEDNVRNYGCTGRIDLSSGKSNTLFSKKVVCLEGEIQGRDIHILIENHPLTIGRLVDMVDVVLDHPSISRLHAKIERNEEGSLLITDLNASNGTYVNDVLLDPNQSIPIKVDDRIRFAEFTFLCKA